MAKISLKTMEIKDVLRYEEAARLVCMKYEKATKRYDNSLDENSAESAKFRKYNSLHSQILEELESRLNEF